MSAEDAAPQQLLHLHPLDPDRAEHAAILNKEAQRAVLAVLARLQGVDDVSEFQQGIG